MSNTPQQHNASQEGYVLHGKFLTVQEANRLGQDYPEVLVKFRKAVRRNGKIIVIEPSHEH